MLRFILLSFVFLGLGFYELSGGASFDPDATRSASMELRGELEQERRDTQDLAILAAVEEDKSFVRADAAEPTADGAGLNLVAFETVANARAVSLSQPAAVTEPTPVGEAASQSQEPLDVSVLQNPEATLQSIAFAGNVISSAPPEEEPTRVDIRLVRGSLVNMRSGPGTDYDVVDQLRQSTPVEILSDTGSGWVELQPVGGGTRGWIAEFLLTDG